MNTAFKKLTGKTCDPLQQQSGLLLYVSTNTISTLAGGLVVWGITVCRKGYEFPAMPSGDVYHRV